MAALPHAAASFDLLQKTGDIPEPGYVQHLQHGHRHDAPLCPADEADQAIATLQGRWRERLSHRSVVDGEDGVEVQL